MATTSTFRETLKMTLNKVMTDREFSLNNTIASKIFKFGSMKDAYEDFQEYGGIGLAEYMPEGASFSIGDVSEGTLWRFWARTFGKEMDVTEEAIADCKYKEAIKGRQRCIRAINKTVEYEAALFFGRFADSNYTLADGVTLGSASHPLPGGGTFSNLFPTPMAPSVAAYTQARVIADGMVSYDGLIEPIMVEKVVHPKEQRSIWEVILNSALDTDSTNNQSRVNVAKRADITPVCNPYWDTTTTASAFLTDTEDGLMFLFREKPNTRSWDGLDRRKLHFAAKARWDIGCTDPRHGIFNNA